MREAVTDVSARLKALRLNGMAVAWAELTEQGGDSTLAASRWLVEHLLQAEDADRAMRSIAHQMKSARFPMHRDLAGFDFEVSQVDKALVQKLSDLSFTRDAQNVVLVGGPGTGKTHLATALGICLLSDSANIPDRNTIWHYQQRLGVDGVTALFQAVDGQLLQRGYMARCGQIIDATLVPAPIQHFTKVDREQLEQGRIPSDWNEAKRRQKDLDATHTKKHGKGYHGYKLSISVDVRHKFIRSITTGTASEHDSTHFDEVLDEHNTSADVYADRGYPSAQRSEMLSALGYREHIQRKAKAGKPLSECQKGRNKRIAKTRARVEHPFAQMRHMGGKLIRTIGQARATVTMTMMATCYNLKRLAKFLDDRVDAFYKNKPSKTEVRLQGANA